MSPTSHSEQSYERGDESVMIRSLAGKIRSWNRHAAELYGWRQEDAVGKISHELLRTQFPKPLHEIESELIRNRRWQGKLVHTTRDGNRLVVESFWSLESQGEPGAVVEINRPTTGEEFNSYDSNSSGTVAIASQDLRSGNKIKLESFLGKLTKIVLVSGAVLCILVASYALTRNFNDSLTKLLYVFVPIGLAGVLFTSLRFKPIYRLNLAVVLVSMVASIYAMEFFLWALPTPRSKAPLMLNLLRSSDKESEAAKLSKKFGVQVDTRSPNEVIAHLNKSGVGAVPFISPGNNLFADRDGDRKSFISIGGTEVIPLAGVSNKSTLLCNENGQWVSYKSDAHGFNNPDMSIWPTAGVNIVALGDSFTQGYCVPPEKSFMGVIRQRYPITLNLGIAGNGPLMMLATMREYLDEVKPKIVLWIYCEDNDLVELQGERKSLLLTRYLEGDFKQSLLARQTDIDQAMLEESQRQEEASKSLKQLQKQENPIVIEELKNIARLSAVRGRLNMPHSIEEGELTALADMEGDNFDVFGQILAQAKSRVMAANGKLYFVYLPGWARYAKIPQLGLKQRARVLSMVNSLQIPIIDIGQVFDSHKDPLSLFPFREPGHYNEIGHRLVAEEVVRNLSKERF